MDIREYYELLGYIYCLDSSFFLKIFFFTRPAFLPTKSGSWTSHISFRADTYGDSASSSKNMEGDE